MLIFRTGQSTLQKFDEASIEAYYKRIVDEYSDKYNYVEKIAANQVLYDILQATSVSVGAGFANVKNAAVKTLLRNHKVYGVANCFIAIPQIEDVIDFALLEDLQNGK